MKTSRLVNRRVKSNIRDTKLTITVKNTPINNDEVKSATKPKSNSKNNDHRDDKASSDSPSNAHLSSPSEDQSCNICAQIVPGPEREKIFAFGKCDHFVCYVCSARLRAICEQSECPICREKLDSVIFVSSKSQTFDKYSLKKLISNEKYKIYFETEAIKGAFDKLLKFECQKCCKETQNMKDKKDESTKSAAVSTSPCPSSLTGGQKDANSTTSPSSPPGLTPKFNKAKLKEDSQGLLDSTQVSKTTFDDAFGLKNHLYFVHKLKLCDLCLTHNKLFPFEYSYYDRVGLIRHIEKGEPKTSHRGHPKCQLCQQTFFNAEELLMHMSREHYHCHLCGRHDSNRRIYFSDYKTLREHFKTRHILCERDNCKHEQFTSVFDNEIDFRMHLVDFHPTSGLSRGEVRHQRTITLEQPAYRDTHNNNNIMSLRPNELPPNTAIVSTGPMAIANSSLRQNNQQLQQLQQQQQQRAESLQTFIRQQRLPSRAEFPALGQTSVRATSQAISLSNTVDENSNRAQQSTSSDSNSAIRPSSDNSTLSQRLVAGPSNSSRSFVRTLGGGAYRAPKQLDESEFPPLPEQPKAKGNKKQKNREKSTRNENDGLSLEQLISASLTISNRNAKSNGKKSAKEPKKPIKQKPIKIQL